MKGGGELKVDNGQEVAREREIEKSKKQDNSLPIINSSFSSLSTFLILSLSLWLSSLIHLYHSFSFSRWLKPLCMCSPVPMPNPQWRGVIRPGVILFIHQHQYSSQDRASAQQGCTCPAATVIPGVLNKGWFKWLFQWWI